MFLKIFRYHLNNLMFYLNPLVVKPYLNLNPSRLNVHYIFPVLVMFIAYFYGKILFVLPNKINLITFKNHPRVFTHQAFPKEVWLQLDLAYSIVAITSISLMGTISVKPFTIDRYKIKKLFNSKKTVVSILEKG